MQVRYQLKVVLGIHSAVPKQVDKAPHIDSTTVTLVGINRHGTEGEFQS